MGKGVLVETVKAFIREREKTLEAMRSRAGLLNKAIPELEARLAEEKERLQKLEAE